MEPHLITPGHMYKKNIGPRNVCDCANCFSDGSTLPSNFYGQLPDYQVWNQLLCHSAWFSNTSCKVPFQQEDLHSLREVTCVQGNSRTSRVGVWNFKSHSCLLKIWCSGHMPDLLKKLTKIHSYFMLIMKVLGSESMGL